MPHSVLLPGTALLHQHCPIWTCRDASTDTYVSFRRTQTTRRQAQVISPFPQSLWRSITSTLQALPFSRRTPAIFHPRRTWQYHLRALDSPDKEQHHLRPQKLRTPLCMPHLIQHHSISYTPLPGVMTELALCTSLILVLGFHAVCRCIISGTQADGDVRIFRITMTVHMDIFAKAVTSNPKILSIQKLTKNYDPHIQTILLTRTHLHKPRKCTSYPLCQLCSRTHGNEHKIRKYKLKIPFSTDPVSHQ